MAMAVHAAGETGVAPPGTVAVVLGIPTEADLIHLSEKVEGFHLFFESDGPYAGQAMSGGFLSPQGKCPAFAHLRLWRNRNET